LTVEHFELGSDLVARTFPELRKTNWPVFSEDALLQFSVN